MACHIAINNVLRLVVNIFIGSMNMSEIYFTFSLYKARFLLSAFPWNCTSQWEGSKKGVWQGILRDLAFSRPLLSSLSNGKCVNHGVAVTTATQWQTHSGDDALRTHVMSGDLCLFY